MHNFIFENGTRLIFGAGCLKEYLASFLERYGPNVLLVTDGSGEGARCGAQDEVSRLLRTGGKTAVECRVRPPCPSSKEARQAARLCREHHVDLILGVGGSAVLDCCKAASLASVCRGDLWEDFWASRGVVDLPPLPVGLVSTAVEVGAVNGAAGLIRNGRCVWRDYPPCDPGFALLDPAYTRALSPRELAAQGFSALAGAMELYLDPVEGTNVSRDLLEALLRGMIRDLRTCRRDPRNDEARGDLMWESTLWGSRFFQLGRQCTFPALPAREAALRFAAETGGGYTDILAVLLLALCRRLAERAPAGMARLARRVWELPDGEGTERRAAQAGADALAAFLRELELPTEAGQLAPAAQEWVKHLSFSENRMVYTT